MYMLLASAFFRFFFDPPPTNQPPNKPNGTSGAAADAGGDGRAVLQPLEHGRGHEVLHRLRQRACVRRLLTYNTHICVCVALLPFSFVCVCGFCLLAVRRVCARSGPPYRGGTHPNAQAPTRHPHNTPITYIYTADAGPPRVAAHAQRGAGGAAAGDGHGGGGAPAEFEGHTRTYG